MKSIYDLAKTEDFKWLDSEAKELYLSIYFLQKGNVVDGVKEIGEELAIDVDRAISILVRNELIDYNKKFDMITLKYY